MSKIKRYELSQQVRVSNSPFSVEGTNIKYDITAEFPIPNECTAFVNGKPVQYRFLANCDTIIKKDQIAQGWANKIPQTDLERTLLTFRAGILEVNSETYANLGEYIEKAPWNEINKATKGRNTKTLYKLIDTESEHKAANDFDTRVAKAILSLKDLKQPQLRNLLRLRTPSRKLPVTITPNEINKQLIDIAKVDPDFINNGIKTNRDKVAIMVSKAVDFDIIKLDTVGFVSLNVNDQVKPIFPANETGGRGRKLEKTIEFFEGEEGKQYLEVINELIEKAEDDATNQLANEEVEEKEQVTT